MAFGLSSCRKSDSGSGTSGGAKEASGIDGAAQDAALAKVKKHWSKGANGLNHRWKFGDFVCASSFY
jgi:hypothetical protein